MDEYDKNGKVKPTNAPRQAYWIKEVVAGRYEVYLTYASKHPRPLRLKINDVDSGLVIDETTLTYEKKDRATFKMGEVNLKGRVKLSLEAANKSQSWPHFKEMKLILLSK